jgi:hypothetical protein
MTTSTSQESQVLPEDILSANGSVFKTKGAASMTSSNKGLTETHTVVPVEGGFVIRPIPVADKAKLIKGDEEEKVFWTRIRHASGNVQTNARLCMPGVNGEILFLRRGERYPLPARFIGSLDSTLHPVSKHVIGQDRADTMWAQDDDYDIEGPATWDDYRTWAARTDHGKNQ